MRKLFLIGLCVMLAVALFVGCGGTPVEPETPAEPAPTLAPQLLAEWTGTGVKTTGPFTITEAPWSVLWLFQPHSEANYFGVAVMRPSGEYVSVVANVANAQQETLNKSYVYDTGVFYLDINGVAVAWAVSVWGN